MSDKQYTMWRGSYRHINYEIVTWQADGRDTWAAYILTHSNQVRLTYAIRKYGFGHDDEPKLLAVSDVVNGGITLYDVKTAPGGDTEFYRVGWDYGHIWDYERLVDKEEVEQDIHRAIDALWLAAPDMRVFCSTAGGWHSLSEGYITVHGEFISRAGVEWRAKQGWSALELVTQNEEDTQS